ncbi:MAG: ABC transporter permease [Clostridia bacterium]|nr:ABC transporter permease [Clostridia bacterium]
MNVFNKVTLESLKKNRTRTIVTIIGILLSTALICAVTTFTSSMQNFVLDSAIYVNGDWHASARGVTTEEIEKVSNDERISQCGYSQNLGYSKIDSENKDKPYINVVAGDNEYFNMLPVHLVSGRLPQSPDEIVLSEQFYADGNTGIKVGDKVTLSLGERTFQGNKLGQEDPVYTYGANDKVYVEEELAVRESRTYTVVGVCESPEFREIYNSPGYTAFTKADENMTEDAQLDVYYKMDKAREVYSFAEETELETTYNRDVLMYSGVSRYDTFSQVLVSLAAILIALIMFGSVALIYNAFSISVSERTKQFGLLSSIGATKKQLRRMVLFEALAVSTIGIPLGVFLGVDGIALTLTLIGHRFNSALGGVPVEMKVCVTWQSLVIATLIAVVTVLISAWIPSIRATRVSAVEAIRQTADIKAKGKQIKTSKLTYKLFGLPGVLAVKQFKRNKKKYTATIVSLFMSIVLFVSASAFTEYLVDSVTTSMSTPAYDLTYRIAENQLNGKTPDEVLELLKEDKHVTKATYSQNCYFTGEVSTEYISEELLDTLGDEAKGLDHVNMEGAVHFVDDAEFKRILKDNNLKEEDFYNPDKPLAIAQDVSTYFDSEQKKYVTLDMLKGDEFELLGEEYTLKSVKTLEDKPLFIDTSMSALNLMYPISMMDKVLPEGERESVNVYTFYFESDNHAASFDSIQKTLSQNGLSTEYFYDIAAESEMNRNLIAVIQVFAYGFVIIISLISVANVFNTISTNVSLRRREFAMLKSVGMTQKGFNKMMNFECLLYGAKALALGLPVSFGITYLIYLAIAQGYSTGFYLPWKAVAIAVLSVFTVVFVTMMYAMRKIKNDNPIDALKNENL